MSNKEIIIFGAGGFAREIYYWIKMTPSFHGRLKGFITSEMLDSVILPDNMPYLGGIDEYSVIESDCFIVAIGDVAVRRKVILDLQRKGVAFTSYIHPSAVISENVAIGSHCIIGPLSVLSSSVVLGDHSVINANCVIGHDVVIGENCVISPLCGLMGNVKLGDDIFIGASAVITPRLVIGERTKIAAGVIIYRNINSNQFVSAGSYPKVLPNF